MQYEFIVKYKKIRDFSLEHQQEKDILEIFICIRDNSTGIVYPHPLTNFIRNIDRKRKAPNTLKFYAEEIKKFLNYLLKNIEDEDELFINLREVGLAGLNLIHGSDYITFLTHRHRLGQISAQTVYRAERAILKLYEWMLEEDNLNERINIIYKQYKIGNRILVYSNSPFDNSELGTEYPAHTQGKIVSTKLHDFGAGRLDLVNLFINTAQIEAPDIALGIAFQCYGGLRAGEVVNLTRSNVKPPKKYGLQNYELTIADRWDILFPDKELITGEQVKYPRSQVIFNVPIIQDLTQRHLERLKRLDTQGKTKNKGAFILSARGNPITYAGYYERFNKVKEVFLELISDDDYHRLTSKPWSTHIGRGIYTNMLEFILHWSPSEIAIARGDKDIKSSLEYIELENVKRKTKDAIEILALKTLESEIEN